MRILYLSISYVPSRRASSVQVMKMCAAFAELGHDVTLVAKSARARQEAGVGDDYAFYGVPASFRLHKLPRPARRGGGVVFAVAVARELVARRRDVDLVYARDLVGAAIASSMGLPVAFEAHGIPSSSVNRRILRQVAGARSTVGIVAISAALRRDLDAAGLAAACRVEVAHDAADPPLRDSTPSAATGGTRRIGYVGNLYEGRGIELIVELARRMPDCQFDIVGGAEADLRRWRARCPPANVVFHGFRHPSHLAEFYRSFDVVLMPHSHAGVVGASGGEDISRWTSPMKMFEYMASGVPLVASDLPVLGEVLHDRRNALVVPAADPMAWTTAIRELLDDRALARELATAAQAEIGARYTWSARARLVLDALERRGATAPAVS